MLDVWEKVRALSSAPIGSDFYTLLQGLQSECTPKKVKVVKDDSYPIIKIKVIKECS